MDSDPEEETDADILVDEADQTPLPVDDAEEPQDEVDEAYHAYNLIFIAVQRHTAHTGRHTAHLTYFFFGEAYGSTVMS